MKPSVSKTEARPITLQKIENIKFHNGFKSIVVLHVSWENKSNGVSTEIRLFASEILVRGGRHSIDLSTFIIADIFTSRDRNNTIRRNLNQNKAFTCLCTLNFRLCLYRVNVNEHAYCSQL